MKQPLSLAEKIGLIIIPFSFFMFYFAHTFSLISLLSYILLCFIAPFLPQFSFFLPIVSRGVKGVKAVALTFDDGPSPSSTPDLLRLLDKHQMKATFFVIGEKAALYPSLIRDIVNKGHSIANHSYKHDSLLMFKSSQKLKKDIQATQSILQGLGVYPYLFRPPAGITNPRLKAVLFETGLVNVNFSCRIFDYGNKRISRLAKKVMDRLRPGDIIMLHDICPCQAGLKDYWLRELDTLFGNIQSQHTILQLEDLINHPVMSVCSD